jgi:osmotically-inducible protein OsmY
MTSLTTAAPSAAMRALQQCSHPALRHVAVQETEETIILSGRVSSYYLKQLAQETIMPARGERQVINRIMVVKED